MTSDEGDAAGHVAGDVRTFLIADVRGYTRFTQTRGDEAAGRLAARFARIVGDVVGPLHGQLLELRGDEALVVFTSPRQAVRAAMALQAAFVESTLEVPDLPLGVGIGIDSGEAVPVEDGYRGGALNLAARLCSLAKAGEVLLSAEARHLARQIDGTSYVERGRFPMKGIDEPVRVLRVVPVGDDPTAAPEFLDLVRPKVPSIGRTPKVLAGVAAAVLVASVVVVATRAGDAGPGRPLTGNAVGRINHGSSHLSGEVPVGAGAGAIASGDGSVWVANAGDGTVSRIDPAAPSAPANTIPLNSRSGGPARPVAVAVGAGAVWVADSNNRVIDRIDPKQNRTVASIQVGNGPIALTLDGTQLWVANSLSDTLSVIDTRRDRVVATVSAGAQPSGIAAGAGSLWVSDAQASRVVRIDPHSRRPVAAISVGHGPGAVVADNSTVWVANELDGTVSGIDPTSNQVTATVRVGASPDALALAGGDLWVADSASESLTDVDTVNGRVSRTVAVGSTTAGVAETAGSTWITGAGPVASHRGGTLRAIAPIGDFGGIDGAATLDPAYAYRTVSWGVMSVVNDGLVTFRRTASPTGSTIVPDLAQSLPQVSDRGRTYTFQLRAGIRFSNRAVVTASDVRTSLERVVPNGLPYYQAIVGAPTCANRPHRPCDLSRGITTDNAAGVVTFRLSKPDPDFLYELSLPFADVLPAGTPTSNLRLRAHPATGPYLIAATRSQAGGRRVITLRRNPLFVAWSGAAQPAGYPDTIEVTAYPDGPRNEAIAVHDVINGRYDWTPDPQNLGLLRQLATTRGAQLRVFAVSETRYLFFNTARRPFNNLLDREAVALAIDRTQLLKRTGGAFGNRSTCQMVPPTMLGYSPTCPYTANPNAAGTWTGTDLARARALVRQAHARGQVVRIRTRPDVKGEAPVVVRALRAIGMKPVVLPPPAADPKLGESSEGVYFLGVVNGRIDLDIGSDGWYADFPEPSNMISPLLSCTGEDNDSHFCNQAIDRQITTAEDSQTSDPARSPQLWAAVDAAIAKDAPVIPYANPRGFDVVSARLGNYQNNPEWGMLIDQVWVR